jgi:hypothetical protein
LKATNGDVERATDWIFSHADELDSAEPATGTCSLDDSERERSALSRRKGKAMMIV